MSKKEAIKSNINMLTALMVVFLTALFAVIGYTFDKRKEIGFIDGCVVFVAMVALAVAFYMCMLLLKKDIKRFGESVMIGLFLTIFGMLCFIFCVCFALKTLSSI